MAKTDQDVCLALLDVLTVGEIYLITSTLLDRVRDFGRRRDGNLSYAAQLTDPKRQQFYRDWANTDDSEVQAAIALLEKIGQ